MNNRLTYLRLAIKSVAFNWRMEVSVLLGTMLASAVLVGGLLVGDSVSYSLRQFALMRLGKTHSVIISNGRFFDRALADRLAAQTATPIAPVLLSRGVVHTETADGQRTQINHVQVVGVDPGFWQFSGEPGIALEKDKLFINSKLAAALKASAGSELSLRIGKPSLMPRDAPLASRKEELTSRGTFSVQDVLSDDRLGRFSLSANQVAPYNVFVNIAWLQERMALKNRANLILVGEGAADGAVSAALGNVWKLSDFGLGLTSDGNVTQLESDRVFLDPSSSQAALSVDQSVGVLTYLVNSITKDGLATPYSFAVACGPSDDPALSLVPEGMRDDQAVINSWLAKNLNAKPGDRISVSYYELEAGGGFKERTRDFSVLEIKSMDDFENERKLMPEFPGLTDVEQCSDWDVGMPMNEESLRDKANQDYWEEYGATPKIVFTLAAGREMWANRFGDTTTVRFPGSVDDLEQKLSAKMDPASLGIAPLPVRENALRAVSEAMSFGELFTYMSFFLILSALLLTGMLFIFGIQQRAEEMGLLLGVGLKPSAVRGLFLFEGAAVALAGSIIGGLLGTVYTRSLIWGLAGHWKGAVASSAILYHAEPETLLTGIVGSFICSAVAMSAAAWRQARRPARELLSGDLAQGTPKSVSRAAVIRTAIPTLLSALAAAATAILAVRSPSQHTVYAFFGAGFLLLIAGLGCSRLVLKSMELRARGRLSVTALGIRNASRRSGRSLAAVVLLGSGCFLVFAVSAMQQDLAATVRERSSGSGGFALFGQATLALPDALESEEGKSRFRIDGDPELEAASFISLKVRDGDDASCFNLNRAQSPRLIGVDPQAFAGRGAFIQEGDDPGVWGLLEATLPDGVIAGLAGDANTAMWNLHKKADPESGDEIAYRDERGNVFRVRLVGTLPVPLSIFQGSILVSKADFEEKYPSESGYRMFVADLPDSADAAAAQRALTGRLDRLGVDVTTTLSRLMEFHEVEATYLNMFLVLGGLGVVLGTLGLGIVVLRNMLERRAEFAILRCVGFSRKKIVWLVFAEHWMLLAMGLACGVVSASVAIYPSISAPGMHVPVGAIALLLAAIVATGLISTALAVIISLRGELIPALRNE